MAVFAFLLGRHLAKRPPRPRHEENRVVAEPRLASPFGHDLAAALALEKLRRAIRRRKGDHADEARLPRARHSLKPAEQLGRALLLRRPQACRADARKPAKCLDLDARIVSQGWQSRFRERDLRLQARVLCVGLPNLFDLAVERDKVEARTSQQVAVFAKLAGVTGCDDESRTLRQSE